jgi:hypothetical protein
MTVFLFLILNLQTVAGKCICTISLVKEHKIILGYIGKGCQEINKNVKYVIVFKITE